MKPKILCAHCSAELHVGDKFCGNCGKTVEWSSDQPADSDQQRQEPARQESDRTTCDTCGTVNKLNTDFCITCGTDLRSRSQKSFQQKPAPSKQTKKEQRPTTKETRPLPLLQSWKVIAGGLVIVGAIVAIELYNSRQSIPTTIPAQQQQPMVPQEGMGANMAALPQIQDMERQLGANPKDMALTLQLANVLHDNRFYDKAITRYKEFLQKNPKDANARVDLGICYKEVGQFEAAKTEMKKALEYEPNHVFAHFNLGIVTLSEGNLAESNVWLKKVVEMAPTSEVGKRAQQLLSQHSNPQILQPK